MATFNDELKKEKIAAFVADPIMCEAVKEELLKGIYTHGTVQEGKPVDATRNWALSLVLNLENKDSVSNEIIGSKLVAVAEGIRFLESSFKEMEANYKPVSTESGGKETTNPAR